MTDTTNLQRSPAERSSRYRYRDASRFHRFNRRLGATRPIAFIYARVLPPLDRLVFRATRGHTFQVEATELDGAERETCFERATLEDRPPSVAVLRESVNVLDPYCWSSSYDRLTRGEMRNTGYWPATCSNRSREACRSTGM
jgi:hypothetical protein